MKRISREVLDEVRRLEQIRLNEINRINNIEKELPNYLTSGQKEDIIFAIENNMPIIIHGKQGPTGKTTLVNILRENNVIAYEKWECLELELNRILDV